MGWGGIKLPDEHYKLWTRSGTNGVYIQECDEDGFPMTHMPEIKIPSELLRRLVAEDLRSHKMRQIEQAEDHEILGLPEDQH